jgi:hypothetical protein
MLVQASMPQRRLAKGVTSGPSRRGGQRVDSGVETVGHPLESAEVQLPAPKLGLLGSSVERDGVVVACLSAEVQPQGTEQHSAPTSSF